MTATPYTIGMLSSRKLAILAEAQNWRCCYCGIRCDGPRNAHNAPSRDHVIPIVAGGLHRWDNEVMACNLCNNGRGAMPARRYLQMVIWRGREKAAIWGRKRQQKRAAARAAHRARAQIGATTGYLPTPHRNQSHG